MQKELGRYLSLVFLEKRKSKRHSKNLGFGVKERNFAKKRIFEFTDVWARMGKAKSRHGMDTADPWAGVVDEIMSLGISIDLFFINTVS